MVIFIIKKDFIMTELQLMILSAAVAVIIYPALKAGAEEVVLDLAHIVCWLIKVVRRWLGW